MTSLDLLRARLGDRYLIERELGRGGMGAVYLARDRHLDRPVALKVLPPEYGTSSTLRERFLRETRLSARFSHPNIVPIYAIEDAVDVIAYAMAYVEGETLTERVRRAGPLSARELGRILQDVTYALAFAHGRDVVHRDIKPDNIMIERATGRALLMDFGIARTITSTPATTDGLTRIGEVVGTPEYMSPEQATGDQIDGRSDLYALGLTARFALTGEVAITGDSHGKILARQITDVLPPTADVRPDLPGSLAAAIDRCLMKDPNERFANAEALIAAIDTGRLAAPEIPVAIRLFAQELISLGSLIVGAILLGLYMDSSASPDVGELDVLLPLLLLTVVVATRVLQTIHGARRLTVAGFSSEEVQRGLAAVVDERAVQRVERRNDVRARAARRRVLAWGCIMLLTALALIRAAFAFRHRINDHHYAVSVPGVALVALGLTLLGVSVVLIVGSPFRMQPTEWLFRLVWLGPVGRMLTRIVSRGVRRDDGPALARVASPANRASKPAANPMPAPPADQLPPLNRVMSLEMRVNDLERWRHEMNRERDTESA